MVDHGADVQRPVGDFILFVFVGMPQSQIGGRTIHQRQWTMTTEVADLRAVSVVELGPDGVWGVHTHIVTHGKPMQDKSLWLTLLPHCYATLRRQPMAIMENRTMINEVIDVIMAYVEKNDEANGVLSSVDLWELKGDANGFFVTFVTTDDFNAMGWEVKCYIHNGENDLMELKEDSVKIEDLRLTYPKTR